MALDDNDRFKVPCAVCGMNAGFEAGSPQRTYDLCLLCFILMCENIATRMRVNHFVISPVETAIDDLKTSRVSR